MKMHLKAILITLLSTTTVMAQDDGVGSDDAAMPDEVTILIDVPTTSYDPAVSILSTAIPSSLLTALRDPAVVSSLDSVFAAGNTPSWFDPLPADFKSALSESASDEANAPSISTSMTTDTDAAEATSTSEPIATSSSESGSESGSESAPPSGTDSASSSSTAGAPNPTVAVFGSVAGAAGVLALAIGL